MRRGVVGPPLRLVWAAESKLANRLLATGSSSVVFSLRHAFCCPPSRFTARMVCDLCGVGKSGGASAGGVSRRVALCALRFSSRRIPGIFGRPQTDHFVYPATAFCSKEVPRLFTVDAVGGGAVLL